MKKFTAYIVPITIGIVLFAGCKKAIENKQEDLILKAMTDGQWIITSFTHNGSNITSDFSPYKFKYYSNKTVDAINNGTVENTGSWDGNATTLTITANFTNAAYPLTLINGSW